MKSVPTPGVSNRQDSNALASSEHAQLPQEPQQLDVHSSWFSSSSGPMSTQEQAGRGGRAGTHHRHSLGRAAFQHGPAASGHVHNQGVSHGRVGGYTLQGKKQKQ